MSADTIYDCLVQNNEIIPSCLWMCLDGSMGYNTHLALSLFFVLQLDIFMLGTGSLDRSPVIPYAEQSYNA